MMENIQLEQLRTLVRNLVRPGHLDKRAGLAFYGLIDGYIALQSEVKELNAKIQSRNTSKPKTRNKRTTKA